VPTEVVIRYLKGNTGRNKLKLQIALQCAPVIKGIKASNAIGIPTKDRILLLELLSRTGISCTCLYESEEKCIFLLFRQDLLDSLLRKEKIIGFLMQYGYTEQGCGAMLTRLSIRLQNYYYRKHEFPHEMGVFLEYPVEDVKAFIENNGKNSLFTGYWKVYQNPQNARSLFHLYDKAKEEAVVAILNGKALYEIMNYT